MTMTHPGLPHYWGFIIWSFMIGLSLWALWTQMPNALSQTTSQRGISLANIPFLRPIVRFFSLSRWPLLLLKTIIVAIFLLVIFAGLYGTSIPERNLATVLTWNIWWAGLIVAIFFLGSSWCAICPWDTLATWMVKPKLWLKNHQLLRFNNSLELTPPAYLRSVWPALLMFIGLTWLELGVGVTIHPYATALLSLLMVVLATISLAIYKNKAFCHYFCPVGRTIGFYSQLAPIALRPIQQDVCNDCTTMECYNGNDEIEACPTQLVMGTLKQNTYCTSCGNCVQSCPQENISWQLRPQSNEAIQNARPHWDEAWFMLGLLALTSFHGLTMMPFWETWISQLGQLLGDSGQLLISFSIGLMISMLIPIVLYSSAITLTHTLYKSQLTHKNIAIKDLFTGLVFVTLPLAFAYHIAHNLNHLVREGAGLFALFLNPLGTDTLPLTMMEKHNRHFDMLISQDMLFAIQGGLLLFGFWIAVKVLRYRSRHILGEHVLAKSGWRMLPMYVYIMLINGFHLWLMMQAMTMRM